MAYAISHVKTTTTEVRIAVATFASTPATPNLARIAVRAAKKADSNDHVSQVICFQYACNRAHEPLASRLEPYFHRDRGLELYRWRPRREFSAGPAALH